MLHRTRWVSSCETWLADMWAATRRGPACTKRKNEPVTYVSLAHRTFERSWNLRTGQGRHFHYIACQDHNVATISGIAHRDAFDEGPKDLCRFGTRFGILERTVKVRDLLSASLGWKRGAGGAAVAMDCLSSLCWCSSLSSSS
jgi:hypothetical protein